jgi:hypothetical protein
VVVPSRVVPAAIVVLCQVGYTGPFGASPINGWNRNVDHLHGFELFEDTAWSQSRCSLPTSFSQGDVKTVSQECNKDLSFDACFQSVVNRANG